MVDENQSASDDSNVSDCFDNIEEVCLKELEESGYKAGFELGVKAGQEEGFALGSAEGKRRGGEIGYYRGFTMTLIQLVQQSIGEHQRTERLSDDEKSQDDDGVDSKSAKILKKLKEIFELTEDFPKTNETSCEEKLSRIRALFRQTTLLLNIQF